MNGYKSFLILFFLFISINARADFPIDTPLIEAAGQGDLVRVKKMVEGGADVNETRWDGESALKAAIRSGHEKTVLHLIEKGADVNKIGAFGEPPLALAARTCHAGLVKILIDAGADLKSKHPVVAATLDHNCDAPDDSESPQRVAEVVRLLIAAGADFEKPREGDTPLMIAARQGNTRAARMLIEAGADENRTREENIPGFGHGKGWTALTHAVMNDRVAIARDLLETGMAPEHVDAALTLAAEKGKVEIARVLLEKGADPASKNREGASVLKLAVMMRRENVMDLLLDAGADPNEEGILLSSAFSGDVNVMRRLIEAGADLKKFGGPAMLLAASYGHSGVAIALIKAGVDPGYRDKDGRTALMRYILAGNSTSIGPLKSAGVDVNARSKQGETALIMAVKKGKQHAIFLLLNGGTDADIKDLSGKTALDYAIEQDQLPMIKDFSFYYQKKLLANPALLARALGDPAQTMYLSPAGMEIPSACILDKTPVTKTPDMKDAVLARLKFMDPVAWTGEIHGGASTGAVLYLQVKTANNIMGWAPAHALIFHPRLGVVIQRTPIHARPSGDAGAGKWVDMMDMVVIKNKKRNWMEIEAREKKLDGWIKKDRIAKEKKEIITAAWAFKKLRVESSLTRDERVASIIARAPFTRSKLVIALRNLQAGKNYRKVTVNTVSQFIKAIGSNKEIHLAPGDYFLDNTGSKANPNVWVNSSCVNELVMIRDVEKLKIVGDPGKRPVRILLQCQSAAVLVIRHSRDVTIRNIVMGHAEGNDDCAGKVLSLYKTSNVVIENSVLFGSGTDGLRLSWVNNLTFKNSTIKACTSYVINAFYCKNLRFENSRFFDNTCKYNPVSISNSQGVHFSGCDFKGNTAMGSREYDKGMFSVSGSSDVRISDAQIRENSAEYFLYLSFSEEQRRQKAFPEPLVEGCAFTDNKFPGGKIRIKPPEAP